MPDKEKLKVKPVENTNLYWVNYKVYKLVDSTVSIHGGGIESQEEINHLKKYLKRKKLI